jgi:glycolate oxidase subunit GlcD
VSGELDRDRELLDLLGPEGLLAGDDRRWHHDATESQGIAGRPLAVARPESAEQTAALVAACWRREIPLVPRGGGTGLVGGAVPVTGGLLVELGRMDRIRELDPGGWRAEAEAGVTTATLRRRARESGLLFPPDPGAAEGSQIGGNVATNAGGPHSLKYGTTRDWLTGLEVVVAPGRILSTGGRVRKDVASYGLTGLFCGSEGTLGIVTAARLRLIPAPPASRVIAGFYPAPAEGCAAIAAALSSGVVPAALEYLDGAALGAAAAAFPGGAPARAGFLVLAEADGDEAAVAAGSSALREAMAPGGDLLEFQTGGEQEELWRWRGGVNGAVRARRGGKLSVDVAVPAEHFEAALLAGEEVARKVGLEAASWGHAGDGNLHTSFLFDPGEEERVGAAERAADELLGAIARLGGSIAAEHGIGWAKRGRLGLQLDPAALELHRTIKRTLDPKGLFNPGKKE